MSQAKSSVKPIAFADAARLLRERFSSFEHWLIIADLNASRLIEQIETRFFAGASDDDFMVLACPWAGTFYAVVTARKRMMGVRQLQKLLRANGIFMRRADFTRDCLTIANDQNLDAGVLLGDRLVAKPQDARVALADAGIPNYNALARARPWLN